MDKDAGTIAALMKRFNESRLPRFKRMLEQVNAGESLSDENLEYLKRVYKEARDTRELVKRNPQYQELVAKATSMYTEIVSKALENEKRAGG